MGKFSDALLAATTEPEEAASKPATTGRFSSALGLAETPISPMKPKRDVPWDQAMAQGFIDMGTLNYGDEAEAALRSNFGGEDYDAALADVRERQENSPSWPYYTGAALGALTPGGIANAGGKALQAAVPAMGKAGRYLGSMMTGAIEGGIAGSGEGQGGIEGRLPEVPKGMVLGAAGGAAGEKIGSTLIKVAESKVAKDIGRLAPDAVAALRQKARDLGIDLTVPELTDLPSLKARQKAIGNLPGTADDLGDFYKNRAGQIEGAVDRFMGDVSPTEGIEAAGRQARDAGVKAMDDIARKRSAAASPIYQRAFAEAPVVDTAPTLQRIAEISAGFPESGQVPKTLARVHRLIAESGGDLQKLHGAKIEIDQIIEAGKRDNSIGNTTRAKLVETKNALLQQMDAASPDYGMARNIFADMSPEVATVREGVAGVIADLPDKDLRLAASKLFSPGAIGPEEAARAMGQIKAASPDAAQAIKRAFLEDAWLKAGKETLAGGPKTNRGALWRKQLLGDQKQRAILEATLEPEEFGALNDLADVLEASGRVKPIGSDTAWNMEIMKAERQKAQPWLAKALGVLSSSEMRKQLLDNLTDAKLAKNSQHYLDVITDPNGIERLAELKRLPINAQVKRAILGQGLGVMGREGLDSPEAPSEPTREEDLESQGIQMGQALADPVVATRLWSSAGNSQEARRDLRQQAWGGLEAPTGQAVRSYVTENAKGLKVMFPPDHLARVNALADGLALADGSDPGVRLSRRTIAVAQFREWLAERDPEGAERLMREALANPDVAASLIESLAVKAPKPSASTLDQFATGKLKRHLDRLGVAP